MTWISKVIFASIFMSTDGFNDVVPRLHLQVAKNKILELISQTNQNQG